MGSETKKSYLILMLLVSTILSSIGQLSFKLGLSQSLLIYLGGYLLIGIVGYGLSTILYLYALGRSHLSWGYSFVGLSYVFTTILAYLVLGENIEELRIVGVIMILIGTVIIGSS